MDLIINEDNGYLSCRIAATRSREKRRKQLRCDWNLTAHNGAYLFILLFFFQFAFFLWTKQRLFLLLPFAFIFTSLITHFSFSVIENECFTKLRQTP